MSSDDDLEEDQPRIQQYEEQENEIIDVEAIEQKLEEEIFEERHPRPCQKSTGLAALRNGPIVLPFIELSTYEWNNSRLKAGKTVELRDGSFLKIKTVVQNVQSDALALRGWKLKRTTRLRKYHGIVLRNLNELIFTFQVDLDDPRHYLEQSVVEVALEDVLRIRKLVCTNYPFPKFRFDDELLHTDKPERIAKEKIKDTEVLVARYKITTKFANASARLENVKKANNYSRTQLETLDIGECTIGCVMPVSLQRDLWRGDTVIGGSGIKKMARSAGQAGQPRAYEYVDLSNDDDKAFEEKSKANLTNRPPQAAAKGVQIYTYGDTFTGGGGAMSGAVSAGLKPLFGTDFMPICCETLRINFPDVKVYELWAHEFSVLPGDFHVDILHLSPPCQVWSPVHTRPGKDDDMNFASLFAVEELIKKTRPRMITLEQTFGILHDRFRPAFNALIRMFVDSGYSVSWQVVKFTDFGLAQSRKRLVIVAAGPGETLPKFPAYTHSKNAEIGLKPWTSVRDVLSKVPRNATQHDIRAAASRPLASWHVWDDSSVVSCITTNGGDHNCHPSGKRSLTFRELAALQGFPHEYFFAGSCAKVIKRQIGNAVPPVIAKILFTSVRKHLERVDAAEQHRYRHH
ncbi:Cytosine-specific methyltransferase [Hyphodiscus hymeniophilus]|uniref:DNA (cytosine-5-)-methyltransferase n=1 Tax=Hyphodiscus hymeniophilus TaxID=353542 RepID=A0A9P6VJS0_9HELO|nr:Cytosine-specific methyltransferase [Hyphodiscus hymeniophilus]